jgi:hypothetical protein
MSDSSPPGEVAVLVDRDEADLPQASSVLTSRSGFYAFEGRLRSLGFREDQEDSIICRWRHRDDDLIIDAMPADAAILGFENRWQGRRSRTPTSPCCLLA